MKRKTTAAAALPACYRQSFAVPFEYPVYFTRDVFRPSNPLLASAFGPVEQGRAHRVLVYVDDGVVHAMPRLPARISAYFGCRPEFDLRLPPIVLSGGERAKEGWGSVQHVMTQLGEQRLCRHSYVVVVGGGSLLDAVGFAVSLVHRGVRLMRLPTTVLAQNDAGVGVKNGMNEHGMKNFVGTFAPPHAVINDFDFLETLDDVHWQGGISEAFKVALIRDAGFFALLERNAARLRARAADAMEELVQRCAILHLEHIRTGNDPFERGAARPLDFGHWTAHKLEAMSGFTLGHGQAVAIGIALDCYYAAAKGLLRVNERDRILRAMRKAGLVLWDDRLAASTQRGRLVILDGLDEFREHLGGQLTITLPDGIGRRVEVHTMDTRVLARGVAWLRRRYGAAATR